MKIKSIESYIDSERQPIKPKDATYKITTVVNPDGSVDHTTSISNEGFNESTDDTVIVRYDLKEVTEEAYDETKHNRGGNAQNTGQFSAGSGGGSSKPDKLKRVSKHEKPKFPSKPQNNPNVQTSLRFKMIEEVKKNFKNIDTDKLLAEAEKSDNEWQNRENLGLQIDDDLAMKFQTSRVMHRTKDTFSSIEKLARKPDIYNTVDDLNDRTGVRVISKDIREVKEAIAYIEENYEIIDEKNYLDDGHPTGSGYRSYHCIIKDKQTGFEAEIQVRTENEDVWANVFHDLYKPHEEKMRRALDTNPEGVKKYANDYSNYLYNIDCCQVYGTLPDLPTELAQAGFSYSKEAELDENDFFDAIIGEIYEMTPDYGFNVVIFDDYAPDGEKLTLIGNYESSEDANEIKLKCEEQGKIAYIYMADDANESFEEEEHPRDGDGKFATKDGGSSDKKDTDISRSLSTRMGRGSTDMGSHRIIEQYNKDNPDSQVEVPQIVNDLWQPMTEYDSMEAVDDFNEKHEEWKSWLDDHPQVKKVFDDMQVEVDEYNKILDDKFKNSKSFFRGSGLEEFDMIASEGMLSQSEKYSFQSLSMRDPSEVGFDSGVVVEYNADFIKDIDGVKTEYTTDIVPIMDFDTDDFMDNGIVIENADSKVNSLFADEQEVRVDNENVQMKEFDEGSVKSVTFNFGKLSLDRFLDRYLENAKVDVQFSTPKQLISAQKDLGRFGSNERWLKQTWDEVVGIMKQVYVQKGLTWMNDVEFKYKFKDDGLFSKQIIESFVEDEHPRDGDGQFATKDGGDDTNKDFDTFKKELKEKIIPTAEENTKNAKVESSVINGINDYAKGKYDGKINFVETQGSFAKGTDLAGSSDLDIFVGFDYGVSVKDMEKIVLELGDNVLKPISDKGEYKIMNGADKKYPESYVDGVEVQIIGTTDVTLDQIKNGMNNEDKGITDGMKTATDRSPHHTRFMKEALKGKEEDVRMVKKFFKDAGVYDASVAKQGFSGFSTEVLIHNLGSFDKVLEFFADFKKGSVIGETSRKFKTPLVMVDPIDENRNLASAFSHGDEDSSTIPNKNLGRLIKTAQSVLKDGKMPEITNTEEDSVTMDFNIDNSIERNEVYSQLYKYANSTAKQFEKNNFGVKVAKDKVTDDFTVDMPRINVDYDDKTGKGSISFGLKEFDLNTELVGGIKKEGLPQHIMDRFYAKHEGKNIVEKDDKLYAEYEGQTASAFLKDIVNREGKHMTKASKLDKFLIDSTITRGNKPFENLTDKPSVTESFEEDEHPRDQDGKFTSKDDGGLNSRVEQKQSVIQSQIDYLQKSMKPESQKYKAFQKVTDEDRRIRYNNKSLQEDIDKLKLELDSPDTTGLPQLPLKQNTHAVQTIEGGMLWKEGVNEPLQGFKKGNSEINVSIPLERSDDDYSYNKVTAERQLNTLKLMWNSLGDEERDTIKSFTIERTPKLIIEDKDGGGFVYKNMDDVATAGYWRPSENKLCMRVDSSFDDDQLKGTFTHEVGHSLWHSIKTNNPERTEAWKVACKKIPPTTKYGKYNKKNWKDMQKMFDEYEKDGWSKFPEEEREKKKENAIKNVEFYEDRYYNELHSEVHMYMMGNNKYKRGTVTKGVEKFLEPYKALHGLI